MDEAKQAQIAHAEELEKNAGAARLRAQEVELEKDAADANLRELTLRAATAAEAADAAELAALEARELADAE